MKSVKLGRQAARLDPRTLRLASYLPKTLPAAPESVDWTSGEVSFGMLANDRLGDCTIAGIGHLIQVQSAATGPRVDFADSQVLDYYSRWAGYVPGDSSTDNGAVELDVLNRWRASPDGFLGWKLNAYADPDPRNAEHVRQAVWRFAALYIGLGLPLTAQDQDVWDYVPGTKNNQPWSWGGHCVVVCGYDPEHLTCVTWGGLKRMTWEFWRRYCEESHALLTDIWASRAPADFALPDLESDLRSVTS